MNCDQWRRRVELMVASGHSIDEAVQTADREVVIEKRISEAVDKRFDEYGLPKERAQ